jgi:hypothetical protein
MISMQRSGLDEGAVIVRSILGADLGEVDGLESVRLDSVISHLVEEGADNASVVRLSCHDAGSCTQVALRGDERSCAIVGSHANVLQGVGRCTHKNSSVSCRPTVRLLTGEATNLGFLNRRS